MYYKNKSSIIEDEKVLRENPIDAAIMQDVHSADVLLVEDEQAILDALIKSKIGELKAFMIEFEPLEERNSRIYLIEKLNNIYKKIGSKST